MKFIIKNKKKNYENYKIYIEWKEEKGYIPRVGDIIFFDWQEKDIGKNGIADFIGIIKKVENAVFYTIISSKTGKVNNKKFISKIAQYINWKKFKKFLKFDLFRPNSII